MHLTCLAIAACTLAAAPASPPPRAGGAAGDPRPKVEAYLAAKDVITGDVWVWLIVGPPFVLAGGGIALATLELEYGNGIFHFCFYVLATVVLHQVAGLQCAWNAAR